MEMQIIDLLFFESTMTKVCLEDIGEGLVKNGSSTNKDWFTRLVLFLLIKSKNNTSTQLKYSILYWERSQHKFFNKNKNDLNIKSISILIVLDNVSKIEFVFVNFFLGELLLSTVNQ